MKQKSVTISKLLCLLIGICLVFSLCVPSIAHAQEIKTVRVG